jgi:hypothetical protein
MRMLGNMKLSKKERLKTELQLNIVVFDTFV